MSQVSRLRRQRERLAEETPEQTEARRAYARAKYWENKKKGKKPITIPIKGLGGYVGYSRS